MAIYCPVYDPISDSWHIQTMGPDGPKKQLITSPLHYYHTMGVSPPVGATFTDDDYLDLEEDLSFDENSSHSHLMDSSLPLNHFSGNLDQLFLQSSASQMNSLTTIEPIPSTSSATQSLSSPLYQQIYQPVKMEPNLASTFSPVPPVIYFPLTSIQTLQSGGKSLNNWYGMYPIKSVHSNISHACDEVQEMLSEDYDYDDEYMSYGKPLTIDVQQV